MAKDLSPEIAKARKAIKRTLLVGIGISVVAFGSAIYLLTEAVQFVAQVGLKGIVDAIWLGSGK